MQQKKLPDSEQKKTDILETSTSSDVPQGVRRRGPDLDLWKPKTELGKKVKSGEIKDIADVIGRGTVIFEEEIVDKLLPNLGIDLLAIGQSKGKFGGGKRSIWKQTQKKTREGNKPKFAALAVVGNQDGYVGLGHGKARETMPAREKATRKAKLNLMKIKRGCGSWECNCGEAHSIPLKTSGKSGSIEITLMPAPKGTGLCVEKECKKILSFAGVKDIYSKTRGHTHTKLNLMFACLDALKNLSKAKISEADSKRLGMTEGVK